MHALLLAILLAPVSTQTVKVVPTRTDRLLSGPVFTVECRRLTGAIGTWRDAVRYSNMTFDQAGRLLLDQHFGIDGALSWQRCYWYDKGKLKVETEVTNNGDSATYEYEYQARGAVKRMLFPKSEKAAAWLQGDDRVTTTYYEGGKVASVSIQYFDSSGRLSRKRTEDWRARTRAWTSGSGWTSRTGVWARSLATEARAEQSPA